MTRLERRLAELERRVPTPPPAFPGRIQTFLQLLSDDEIDALEIVHRHGVARGLELAHMAGYDRPEQALASAQRLAKVFFA